MTDEQGGSQSGAEDAPAAGAEGGAQGSPEVPRRSERRVYLGGGAWQTADGAPVAPAATQRPAPAGKAAAAPSRPAPAGTPPAQTARPRLSPLWPLRVLLTLPIVWGAAVAAGLGIYLIALASTVGDPGLSDWALRLCGAGALAAALVLTLAIGGLLRERPRGLLGLVVLVAAAVGAVTAAVLAALGLAGVPVIGAAALLGYAAVVLALLWALPDSSGAAAAVLSQPVVDQSGRRWVQVGAPAGGAAQATGAPRGAGAWIDTPARWSWDARLKDGARSPAWFALGILGAVLLAAAAVAVGFAAFSLFAGSFVAGQVELGWQDTLLSTALNDPEGGGALGVVTLVLANLGCAALFGLLAWAGALCVGGWRGRITWRWAVVLGVLLLAGAVAWLLDGSLPRL